MGVAPRECRWQRDPLRALGEGLQVAEANRNILDLSRTQTCGEIDEQLWMVVQKGGLHGDEQGRWSFAAPMPLQQVQFIDDRLHELAWVMTHETRVFFQDRR